ncbi:MAG: hypothetical protein Q4G51_07835 [Dermatophilus congolensis]|nr:hypothetical protein [Dermatophilus congolensis]
MTQASPRSALSRLAEQHAHRLYGFVEPHRVMVESAALAAAFGPLTVTGPIPDTHPVLVVPGISGGPQWCFMLRRFLALRGHAVFQPLPGSMKGTNGMVYRRLTRRIRNLANLAGEPISVIGWSVGGVFARQAAMAAPAAVRQVITMGTPVGGPWYSSVPGSAKKKMPVPTTAIYSRTDPWFHYSECIQPKGAKSENIEVVSSHFGMATNPIVYQVISDRLAQRPGEWHHYQPPMYLSGAVEVSDSLRLPKSKRF